MAEARAVTPEQLAEKWECSPNHVRNLIKRGELRAWRLGSRLLRIPPDAIEEFERCRQTTASDGSKETTSSHGGKAESVIAIACLREMKRQR